MERNIKICTVSLLYCGMCVSSNDAIGAPIAKRQHVIGHYLITKMALYPMIDNILRGLGLSLRHMGGCLFGS
jgi:hypothetical protein